MWSSIIECYVKIIAAWIQRNLCDPPIFVVFDADRTARSMYNPTQATKQVKLLFRSLRYAPKKRTQLYVYTSKSLLEFLKHYEKCN